ncbi:MAG: tripartite tricarboxylate transporter TctB family protein [Betaproteobacteria bacterium]|nr:tripartite tricarboxylate transporter TctB family protein [Betaproteobacteria bacterium]NBT75090.1 tripartite tricarboxylate transporter TctB family protein [Betaproteobacteria bacterium]NDF03971.1 tripartite tricarboxylate transporter TctB family protein [Betaproteobacteria bacterium]
MNPRAFSLALLVFVALSAWQVIEIPASPVYAEVGASFVPGLVVGLLAIFAMLYVLSAWRHRAPDAAEDPEQAPLPSERARALYFIAGCAVLMLLIKPLGFGVAGAACGVLIARAFDAPLTLRSLLISSAISVSFWLLFAGLLGVELGPLVKGLV